MDYTVYTDGACSGNPGPGGWAAVIFKGAEKSTLQGGAPETTNNIMELKAAIEALDTFEDGANVALHTDSQYLVKGMTEWVDGWKRRGWVTGQGTPVKNRDLWEALWRHRMRLNVSWRWVKGHADNEFNNEADKLAVMERNRHAAQR